MLIFLICTMSHLESSLKKLTIYECNNVYSNSLPRERLRQLYTQQISSDTAPEYQSEKKLLLLHTYLPNYLPTYPIFECNNGCKKNIWKLGHSYCDCISKIGNTCKADTSSSRRTLCKVHHHKDSTTVVSETSMEAQDEHKDIINVRTLTASG